MELIKPTQHIPNDIVKILLQFDGRIKYRNGHYINTIDRNDDRYAMLDEVIKKKIEIYRDGLKEIPLDSNCFVHYMYFNNLPDVKLTYFYYGAKYPKGTFGFMYKKRINECDIHFTPVATCYFT